MEVQHRAEAGTEDFVERAIDFLLASIVGLGVASIVGLGVSLIVELGVALFIDKGERTDHDEGSADSHLIYTFILAKSYNFIDS